MIKTLDAIRVARDLIGTPYAELDCINLVKKVIRDAPGGVPGYTTAGTNTLWRSYEKSGKYRDLTWRQDGLSGAKAGMLAFKAEGEDYHHVGIVTDAGTVVHSSSTQGGRGVVETPLTAREGWTHLAVHRYIETSSVGSADTFPKGAGSDSDAEERELEDMAALYQARVMTVKDPLSVRQVPMTGKVIDTLPRGAVVEVYSTGEWPRVRYGETMGYVSAKYLERIDDAPQETETAPKAQDALATTTLLNLLTGDTVMLVGSWRVAQD